MNHNSHQEAILEIGKLKAVIEAQDIQIANLQASERIANGEYDDLQKEVNTYEIKPLGTGQLYFKATSLQIYDALDGLAKLFEPRYAEHLAELIKIGKRP